MSVLMPYNFYPEQHGFEPISMYPELLQFYNDHAFVKIIVYDYLAGGLVYWYTVCTPLNHNGDQRFHIVSGVYNTKENAENRSGRTEYLGLISGDDYAKVLLMHLFATTMNYSVYKDGRERYDQRLGVEMRKKYNR